MAFFAVFGLILLLGLLRKRPNGGTYLIVAAAAGLATLWEVLN